MSVTQREISDHLDLSQAEVSKFLASNEIDWKTSTLDEIRIVYLRKLRAQAAGHRSEDGLDLVRERVMTERVDRELKQYTLAEKKKELINVAQLEPELQQMVAAFRTELMARDDKLKADLDQLHDIDVDIQVLNDYTNDALRHLARYNGSSSGTVGAAGVVDQATSADPAD